MMTDLEVRRQKAKGKREVWNFTFAFCLLTFAFVRRRRSSAAWPTWRSGAGASDAAGRRADRSHRLLGVDHRRRMAVPRHAAERRHALSAAQPRSAADRQRLGSGQRRSRGEAVQGLWRRRRDAASRPDPHHLGEPDHVEARGRCRDADASAALRHARRPTRASRPGRVTRSAEWQVPGGVAAAPAARRRRPTTRPTGPRASVR